jgi:uncharacterized membrane protein
MPTTTMGDLSEARARGQIDDQEWEAAADVLASSPPSGVWRAFLDRGSHVGGTALILAGVIYVVAFNWAGLGYLSKLIAVASLVALSGAAGVLWGGDRLGGRLAMTSSAVLTGPLLVIYSQAYQTGANPWTLFALWAALITPFALGARLWGLWLLWLCVLDVAVLSWGWSTAPDLGSILPVLLALALGHTTVVALTEWRSASRSLPRAAAATGFAFALVPALAQVISPEHAGWAGPAGVCFVCGAAVLVQAVYWWRGRDLFMVALSAASLIVLATTALAIELGEVSVGAAFFVGMALVLQSLLVVAWTRAAQHTVDPEAPCPSQ